MADRPDGILIGKPEDFARQIAHWSSRAHVVSPPTAVLGLPWGCAIACSFLDVSPLIALAQVYPVEDGRLCLAGWTIDRIGAALGVCWDDQASRRLDDRSHPAFCAYRAVGHYRAFDGSWTQIMADKVTDLRDASAQVRSILAKEGKNAAAAIEKQRAWIDESSQTKARLRALRSVGLRLFYKPADLSRPFLVCRVCFIGRPLTPQDAEPSESNRFAMQAALAIMTTGPRGASSEAFIRPPSFAHVSPPPLGSVPAEEDDPGFGCAPASDPANPPPQPPQSEPAPAAPGRQAPPTRPVSSKANSAPAVDDGTPVAQFGQGMKGKPLDTLSDGELSWYRDAAEGRYKLSELHAGQLAAEVRRRDKAGT